MKPSQAKKDIKSRNDRKEEVLNLSQILNPDFLSSNSDKDVLCCKHQDIKTASSSHAIYPIFPDTAIF